MKQAAARHQAHQEVLEKQSNRSSSAVTGLRKRLEDKENECSRLYTQLSEQVGTTLQLKTSKRQLEQQHSSLLQVHSPARYTAHAGSSPARHSRCRQTSRLLVSSWSRRLALKKTNGLLSPPAQFGEQ